MGDWDVGPFENETAREWLQDLLAGESTAPIFRALVTVAKLPSTGYLQAPDCECAIAAAEMVVAARGRPAGSMPEAASEWLEARKFVAGTEVVNMALSVLKRIMTTSELKELWEDTDSVRDWYESVNDLHARLEESAQDRAASIIVDRENESEDPDELLQQALALAAQGNHDEAIPMYDRIIEINPELSIAFLGRGTAYLEIGENRKAVKDISQSIKLDPDVPEAYYLRAESLFRLAEYEQALDDLDLLIKAEPDRPEALWKRALTLERMRSYLNAVDDFTKVIESGMNTSEAYMHRADCYDQLGKKDLAEKDRKAAKSNGSGGKGGAAERASSKRSEK